MCRYPYETKEGDIPPPPRTRGECIDGPRPCPHLNCKYHLWNSLLRDTRYGSQASLPRETCILDIADKGGVSLDYVGELLGISRQRVLQLETRALAKARKMLNRRKLTLKSLTTIQEN